MDRVTEFLETEFPDAEERAMLLGIAASPTDKTAKLVYADWLEDRSDPRGEYVRLLVRRGRKNHTTRMTQLRRACSGPWLSLMGELHQPFASITADIEEREETRRGWNPTVSAVCGGGLWEFYYSGNLLDGEDGLTPVIEFLSAPAIAGVLRAVTLDGHADRHRLNGTLPVELDTFVQAAGGYPYLDTFATEQGEGIIVGNYDEAGQLGCLLAACPRLRKLVAPSAPDVTFFAGPPHPLEELDLYTGYDTQRFVPNLTRSSRFPKLRALRYNDFCCEYMAPRPEQFTPCRDWEAFFRSPVCAALRTVDLSGTLLTETEVRTLLAIRSEGVSISRSSVAP